MAIAPQIHLREPDGTQIIEAIISFTANTYHVNEDVLVFDQQFGIQGVYDDLAGQLVLTGNASAAAYEAALRSVHYANEAAVSLTPCLRNVVISVRDLNEEATETTVRIAADLAPRDRFGTIVKIPPITIQAANDLTSIHLSPELMIVAPDVPGGNR